MHACFTGLYGVYLVLCLSMCLDLGCSNRSDKVYLKIESVLALIL